MDKLNVHNYDTILDSNIVNYINSLQLSNDTNNSILLEFRNKFIQTNKDGTSIRGLNLIIDETSNNIDSLNNLDAKKILLIIINIYNQSDEDIQKNILEILKEQMEDMFNTGQCSQGRTIRLFQTLISFM